jgi:hypothetical protein
MRIIRHSSVEDCVSLSRVFERVGEPRCGFSFPCDAAGNVEPKNEAAAANLALALAGRDKDGTPLRDLGVERLEWSYRVPAVGECDCGAEVELANFTNTCDACGADFNSAGQRLAPRECWGEETGEHWSECY